MSSKKTLQELTIKDGFMFFALMSDPDLCRELLELILEKKIEKVVVHQEDSLMYHPKFHGVRLDVIAIENGTERKFNVEMQAEKKESLEQRSRYYHSQIDMDMLTKGANYNELADTYVIFICDFDPFGDHLYRYRYQMQCSENGRVLNDGTYTIFLNSKGTIKDQQISDRLIAFLEYVANPELGDKIEDTFVSKVEQRVQSIRFNREWEAQYMLLRETLREEREQARAEGLAEGLAEGQVLVLIDQILKKITKDKELNCIADELELDVATAEKIYNTIIKLGVPDDKTVIYKALQEK